MSLIGDLFGYGSGQSIDQQSLSLQEIRSVVSRSQAPTVTAQEQKDIQEAIDKARRGNGKISMKQIEDALNKLRQKGKISIHDQNRVVTLFERHFSKRK